MDLEVRFNDRKAFFSSIQNIFKLYNINDKIPNKYLKWKGYIESGIIRNCFRFSVKKRIRKNHYSLSIIPISSDNAKHTVVDLLIDLRKYLSGNEVFIYNYKEYLIDNPELDKILIEKINDENKEFLNMINVHYKYLESELSQLNNTIFFDKANMNVFGVKNYQIILSAANLFEQCAKRLSRNDYSNMKDWKKVKKIQDLATEEVFFIPIEKMVLDHIKPMNSKDLTTPSWWDTYNQLKHIYSLKEASLINTLNSLSSAGLIINCVTFEINQTLPFLKPEKSELFTSIQTYSPIDRQNFNPI